MYNIRKAQPALTSVHVDRPLTNIAIDYIQSRRNYVAGTVFPMVNVPNASGGYFVWDRADLLRSQAQKRAPGAAAARSGMKLSTGSYLCEREALEFAIPDPTRANQDDPINMERNGVRFVMDQVMKAVEVDWAATFFSSGVWGSTVTGSSWSSTASNPISDVRTQRRTILARSGFDPNVMVLGAKVYDDLVEHPDIKGIIDRGQVPGSPAVATQETLAAAFGLDRVVVARAVRNTAAEDVAGAYSFILGNRHALLAYAAPAPSIDVPSAGYSFVWNDGDRSGGIEGVYRYRDDTMESDIIGSGLWYDHVATATELGCLFFNAVAA